MNSDAPKTEITPRLVYSPAYNIRALGFERLHPFDSRKYGKAWRLLKRQFGAELADVTIRPRRPIGRDRLLSVHTPAYLARLRDRKYAAQVIEVPQLRHLPAAVIDWCVLRPMRYATMGTILAAREARRCGLAVNLSGGYHHAGPDRGEGFSVYADAALAIADLHSSGALGVNDRVAYVDCDAHQGNGFCRCVYSDSRVFIYDQFNGAIYPWLDARARSRVDCAVPLTMNCHGVDYLAALRSKLPPFLDAIARNSRIGLAIYNAGTDIVAGDPLGRMNVSAEKVIERDRYVIGELTGRGLPTVVLTSGGYTRESYKLIAAMIEYVLTAFRARTPTSE
jgi:histone deacetylase 11